MTKTQAKTPVLFHRLLIAVFMLIAGAARGQDVDWAQKNADACNDALGYVGCANLGKPQGPAALPPGIWGAIAFSTATFQSGYSWGQQNGQSAGNAAASECYRVMNAMRDCPVVGTFSNACAALATSGKEGAWGYSGPFNSIRQAMENALERCQKGGGHSCAVVASLCSPGGPKDNSDLFTAIAVSDGKQLTWGVSWNEVSKNNANVAAINYCRKQGGQQCKVQMWASNACVALAAGDDGAWGADWNVDKKEAGNKALKWCVSNKGKNCSLKVSSCATDPR
jgi:hypothetical protein